MSQRMHRRTILQSIVAVAATTAFGCSDEETSIDAQAEKSRPYFPQSVASGDPRPDSVVLWTRAVDQEHEGDVTLSLEVSTEESFGQLVLQQQGLTAKAVHDNAIKVKVTNLQPRTTYYYRFVYEHDGEKFVSPVGRTRTAPAAGDDVPVKFVVGNCQDYVGRYYNAWQRLLQLDADVDAIVFLGDYIYETTGDPAFQSANTTRGVTFSDPASAQVQKSGVFQYLAASSLSNYRDIYKNLRKDPIIQKVHERYPFIVVWDDHEFSDDCWGANATYEDGRRNELQTERRRNGEQAFFEFIPIDTSANAAAGPIDVNAEPRFPNTRIYRDFEFGKHVRLIVTDYRTYRPDHLIPEDAYPGTVVMDQAVLTALGVASVFNADTFAYIDVDAPEYAAVKGGLQQAYVALAMKAGLTQQEATEKAGAWVKGKLALAYVNQVLAQLPTPPPPISADGKPRGMAYVHMGKVGLFDIRGTRYVVVKDTFDLYAAYRYSTSNKDSENAWGPDQEAWFQERVKTSNTWKVVVSSVSFTSLVWDLRAKSEIPDPSLRQRFYFNVDHWDGFPTKKKELLGSLKANNVNTLVLSGDIHASYASVEGGIPALTGPAISSGTVQELAGTAVMGAGYSQGSAIYRYAVAEMDATLKAGNPGLVFANSEAHGFMIVDIRADQAVATYHLIPSSEIHKDYSVRSAEELKSRFTTQAFRVQNGTITPA
ncbi:alkaline phosphatase D family protein [Hyalangium gracile]|uniref:alkaline phosphatase D family protein n=1 Tax=Hyalangium gracile TaxID=394092 RepID=UPI001CCDB9BA|nr:alkaline phosphatase D family protein [Hyalangium gracile]